MAEKKRSYSSGGEVAITVSGQETPKDSKQSSTQASPKHGATSSGYTRPPSITCSSPVSPNKPPKYPERNETLTRKRSLARSIYSKPKSRFEQSFYVDSTTHEESEFSFKDQTSVYSPSMANSKTTSMISRGGMEDDEYEEIYNKTEEKVKTVSITNLIELVLFLCMLGILVTCLFLEKWKNFVAWGLEIWKWSVLVMVIFSGLLITNWFMHFVVFVIEKNFLLRKKLLYYVHGLKQRVQVVIWLSLVLITWVLLFKRGVKRSDIAEKILHYVTWTIVSLLTGAFLWLLKTLLLKILASNFNLNTFFDRIQESIFHQYILQALSGYPLIEEAEKIGREPDNGRVSFRSPARNGKGETKKVIDMGKIHKLKQENVSAWTMRGLVKAIKTSGLSTLSNPLDETLDGEQTNREITNEAEAVAAAYDIFKNVAQPGCNFIEEDDLLRFLVKEEVDLVLPLLDRAESRRINRKSLTNWVVKIYNDRKALRHSLIDTETAVKQLNRIFTGTLIVVNVIIWLLLMEIATTKVILLLSSHLVALAFMIGSTCKTLFEAIVFLFVVHPFDVGDRCVVDGVQLLVEEMNLLTTVFLKLDNEKVFYPNSVLATKPISNYYRSPEMGDTVEFSIDFMTPVDKIGMLKAKIKNYLERNLQHWQPNHSVVVQEIENVDKLNMILFIRHTINFQEFGERNKRRTELMIALKKMFEDLDIRYNLLPQQLHLTHLEPDSTFVTNTR